VRVVVVAEYYPSDQQPALGIWAHRQALAARDAGADVRVLVLHRPLPTRAELASRRPGRILRAVREPLRERRDGLEITRVPFVAPPRPLAYGSWGAFAAPSLRIALRRLRRRFPYDLVHAHYAAPAGDAVLRTGERAPLVVSVHGGDVLGVVERWPRFGGAAVRRALGGARIVLANSAGIEARCRQLGARSTRVLHLGTDLPSRPAPAPPSGLLVTVANLVARKRHRDVLDALALLSGSHPGLRWRVIGDGPERPALERRARELGLAERVEFRGALAPQAAVAAARQGSVFVLPSVDEAFGVAYVEAMAAGLPAVGCAGEAGPEEIAACGGGLSRVPPRDPAALAAELHRLLSRPDARVAQGAAARATVERCFTWERCGADTLAAYADALT
jgi:glycosyltransferase involved in cell wall biosynthesis